MSSEPGSPESQAERLVLNYAAAAPPGSTLVFDLRDGGLTIIDRPRRWLGRYGASVTAVMLIVVALTIVNLNLFLRDGQWRHAVVLGVLWILIFPLLVDRVWKGRIPGIVEVLGGRLVLIRPDFRGRMFRYEYARDEVLRLVVVPQLWNMRLQLVGELQIELAPPGQCRRTIAVLRGHRVDELKWAREELLRAMTSNCRAAGQYPLGAE
jgi:hypothetical protein